MRASGALRPVTVDDVDRAERCRRGRIVLIDDEASVREAFGLLLAQEGYAVDAYPSAAAFLAAMSEKLPAFPGPVCVLSDVKMPEQTGLAMLRQVAAAEAPPIVLMSGASGPAEVVEAFRGGVFDFLLKPIHPDALLSTVRRALDAHTDREAAQRQQEDRRRRVGALTPREREVIALVAQGEINRVIGSRLGISLRTVKLHRHHAMEKLGVDSVADLAVLAREAGL